MTSKIPSLTFGQHLLLNITLEVYDWKIISRKKSFSNSILFYLRILKGLRQYTLNICVVLPYMVKTTYIMSHPLCQISEIYFYRARIFAFHTNRKTVSICKMHNMRQITVHHYVNGTISNKIIACS